MSACLPACLSGGLRETVWCGRAGGSWAATTEADLNQWLVEAEYAVRGEILDRSAVLQKQLDAGEKLPFEKIVACNIGNPQALGQKPLSFNRQVLSLVTNPDMLDDPAFKALYPPEVVERAEKYKSRIGGGIGAYTVPTLSRSRSPLATLAVIVRAFADTTVRNAFVAAGLRALAEQPRTVCGERRGSSVH